MQRVRKPTYKVIDNLNQQQNKKQNKKKQVQKQVLQKRIEKAQVKLIEKAAEPFKYDDIEIIRDTTKSDLYKGLYYDDKENLTKLIRLTIQEYPEKLPPIFKGQVPLLIEKEPIQLKQTIYLSKLEAGEYQTAKSKSDKGISSGIKTLLKTPELQKYDKDDLTDFIKNHREVFYHILLKCKDLSLSTLKNYVVKLMRVLFLSFKGKTSPVYIKYASILKDLATATQAQDDNNTLNDNEKTRFLDWSIIIHKQKELVKDFNSFANKKSKNAYNANLNLILLSLYTLTPPLRREVFSLCFKQAGDTVLEDYVNVRSNDVKLELNLDKKKHDPITIELNKELGDILRQSLELYPRKYLFTSINKYPDMSTKISEGTVGERLKKMFLEYDKNIGASILRSSYATYRFNSVNGNLSMTEIKEMARLMRTSPTYLLTSYRKIINPNDVVLAPLDLDNIDYVRPNEAPKIVNRPVEVINRPIIIKKDPYEKHNEYMVKKYNTDDEHRSKMLNQQAKYRAEIGTTELQKRKIISMLRNSPAYCDKVKQSTLDKYGLNLNDYK